eukprot:CAMPEP_0172804514 /NCGR_PEP_ID=MMETSP1075-20121228/5217_1 /TAXON_ID=2916 /ORGANISM="Ceratium fusus, Strain PA161109" /LENGTH=158 /DNA_ID=CAMNT_0013643097 /DNA_START=330 /DNA_END=804 /DNA_ORIENTATION=-
MERRCPAGGAFCRLSRHGAQAVAIVEVRAHGGSIEAAVLAYNLVILPHNGHMQVFDSATRCWVGEKFANAWGLLARRIASVVPITSGLLKRLILGLDTHLAIRTISFARVCGLTRFAIEDAWAELVARSTSMAAFAEAAFAAATVLIVARASAAEKEW